MGAPATWACCWSCWATRLPSLALPVRGEPVCQLSRPTLAGPLPCSHLPISSPGCTPWKECCCLWATL